MLYYYLACRVCVCVCVCVCERCLEASMCKCVGGKLVFESWGRSFPFQTNLCSSSRLQTDITGFSPIFSLNISTEWRADNFSSRAHSKRNTSQRTNSMAKYETTLDLEAGAGGVYHTTVAPIPVKPSRSWIWKTLGAIVIVALCAVAALFFSWNVTVRLKL